MVSTLWLCSSPINQTGANKDDSDLNSGFFKCRVSLYKFLLFEMQNLKLSWCLQDSPVRRLQLCCQWRGHYKHGDRAASEGKEQQDKHSQSDSLWSWFGFICVFRERQETWTERVTLVLFSISCFPLTLPQLRTGKPGSTHSLDQDTLLGRSNTWFEFSVIKVYV